MDDKTKRILSLLETAKKKYSEKYHTFIIPNIMSRKFVAYCAMRNDLLLINDYIHKMKEIDDSLLLSSLTYSLISLYGKCFTDASRNGYPKLEPNQLFKNDKIKDTHDFLMDLRHQFIAHRGDTESEVGLAVMTIPKNDNEEKSQIHFLQQKRFNIKGKLDDVNQLVDYILNILDEKISVCGQKLYSGFLEVFTPEELSYMSLNYMKDN